MKRKYFAIAVTMLMCAAPLAAEELIYQWVDADGVIHYSDQPPPEHITPLILPAPEYEARPAPSARERAMEARLARLKAYVERIRDERQQERLARARAEAAALRAQLAAELAERDEDNGHFVRGVWYPPFYPPRPHYPPVYPPLSPNTATSDSAFDRLAEARDRLGPGG